MTRDSGAHRDALLKELAAMPMFLEARIAALSSAEARVEGADRTFSPVEQCWHLADLERDGFGARIQRLVRDEEPSLPDFDGARVAREGRYRGRSLREGLLAFREARLANLRTLHGLRPDQWSRGGTQDGVGRVTLGDLPRLMAEHDAAHRAEIDAWVASRRRATTSPSD